MTRHRYNLTPNIGAWIGASALSMIGGWLAYSRFGIDHDVPMPLAIDAEQERFKGSGEVGFMSYYVDRSGDGTPLVLIHSINAAATSYEMRPIFQRFRGSRPLYALDLPGFGFSERADRVYSVEGYTQAILDFLQKKVGAPAHVVALSLGSEFAARAAHLRPEWFRTLTMISPSGFTDRSKTRVSQRARQTGTSSGAYRVLANPMWSQGFYDLLATRPSIYGFLQLSFNGQVDRGLAEYDILTAHQRGARFAPLYFVSGTLFSPTICEDVYDHLRLPVLVLYDRDAFVRFDTLPQVVATHSNWRAVRLTPTKGLPQFEQMDAVATALESFWRGEIAR